ncbi:MAG: Uma2 family endonuclease [Bacteroidota bacterium]
MKNLTYPTCTLEEYLLCEEQSEYRNEFHNGEIEAMAGESQNHSILCHNIHGLLFQALGDRNCKTFSSNMKVYIPECNVMYYPDVSVICGVVYMALERNDIILNPLLLFEVLSKSTAKFDQGEKFDNYKTLDSLQEYVLIDQYRYKVQVFVKEKDKWKATEYIDPTVSFFLKSIGTYLSVATLYRKVEFP